MEKSVNPPFFCFIFSFAAGAEGVLLYRGEKDLDLV